MNLSTSIFTPISVTGKIMHPPSALANRSTASGWKSRFNSLHPPSALANRSTASGWKSRFNSLHPPSALANRSTASGWKSRFYQQSANLLGARLVLILALPPKRATEIFSHVTLLYFERHLVKCIAQVLTDFNNWIDTHTVTCMTSMCTHALSLCLLLTDVLTRSVSLHKSSR
jgi:hypothetical protein